MPRLTAEEKDRYEMKARDGALPLREGVNLIGFDNRIDARRICSELGWRPRVSYVESLRLMAAEASAQSDRRISSSHAAHGVTDR